MPTSISSKTRAAIQSALNRENISITALHDEATRSHGALADVIAKHFGDSVKVRDESWVTYIGQYLKVIQAISAKHEQFAWFGNQTTEVDYASEHGGGYFKHFQQGSIYFTDSFGAHEIHGDIRAKYAALGWHRSFLGFPETDELGSTHAGVETRYNNFQNGTIEWTLSGGAFVDLSLTARIERHQLGAWVHLSGQGFTPGGTVRFSVEGLTGFQGAKSTGVFAIPNADSTFADVIWDGRTWTQGGNAVIRAMDQGSGRSATAVIPPLY